MAAATGSRLESALLQSFSGSGVDVLVNCTPVGMKGGLAPIGSPVPLEALQTMGPGCVVMDTVYNPIQTPLLKAATETGLRVVDGLSMFVNQAARQFEGWTGKAAPKMLFDRLAREHLGREVGGP